MLELTFTLENTMFLIRTTLVISLGLVTTCALRAQVVRDEIHTLTSITAPENAFLSGTPRGVPSTLAGDLRIPRPGSDRLPVVVLLHGTGGISGQVTDWEQELNAMGIATFRLDSYTGRGLTTTFNDQDQFGRLNMMYDAWRAFELLERHPRIDPERIALMGFSLGGQATLAASTRRFQKSYGPTSRREFATYVPFYPQCNIRYRGDEELTSKPVRVFHGSADDWAPIAPCRPLIEQAKSKGADISLTEFPDAHHIFDWQLVRQPLRIGTAQAIKACRVQEGPNATYVNAESGADFTWKDACVTRGATIGFNEAASVAARKSVKEHLALVLRP